MAYKVHCDDIEIGQTIGDMHLHSALSGDFAGWDVTAFQVADEVFAGMWNNLPRPDQKPLSGKMAYVVSVACDIDGYITSVLVMYKYDISPCMATISFPKE